MFSTWSWQRRNCAMHLKLAKNCLRVGVGTWICFETVLPDLFKSRMSSFTSMPSSWDVPTVVFVTESNGCISLNHLNWSCMWTLSELLTLTQKLYLYINFCHVGWNFWQGTWKLLICFFVLFEKMLYFHQNERMVRSNIIYFKSRQSLLIHYVI